MSQEMLPGIDPPNRWPKTEEDWIYKWIDVSTAFSPNSPVQEAELFAGRRQQIAKIIDGIFQIGQHIVIHGDRGVGKTSLLNTIVQRVFEKKSVVKFFFTQCFERDNYVSIWERAFKEHSWPNGDWASDDIDDSFDPDKLFDIVRRFNPNESPIFIFDEFDRIHDDETKTQMAETIKLISDRSSYATIIIAGVGKTITDLISEHESIRRALRQIEMHRMSTGEIQELIVVRLTKCDMTTDGNALDLITWLAHGMPGYAHLLGKYSAKRAIDQHKLNIDMDCVLESLDECLDETYESTRRSYALATQSAQPNNQLREALLACALSERNEFGEFGAASVRKPMSAILGRNREIPDFSRHLHSFCSKDRGPILERLGTFRNYRYRFIDPMMMSYVVTKGVRDKMIPAAKVS